MVVAGSLRIETFEGSRPRLRRTRQGYGRSIRPGAFRADELRSREALRAEHGGCGRRSARLLAVAGGDFRGAFVSAAATETHVGCACRSKRVFRR